MAQRDISEREKEKDTHRQAEARQKTSNLYSKLGEKARENISTRTRRIAKSTPPAETHDERTQAESEELRGILGVSN